MIGRISAAALAKAKIAGLVTVSLTAGGVGGAVALSRVAPLSQMVRDSAATATPTPDSGAGTDSSTVEPDTTDVASPVAVDPTADPESGDAQATSTDDGTGGYALPECTTDVRNHGAYVSTVAHGAPKDPDAAHGDWTSQAAHGDCGKPENTGDGTDAGPDGTHGKSSAPHGKADDARTSHGHQQDARTPNGHAHQGAGGDDTGDAGSTDDATTVTGTVDAVTDGTTAHGHRGHHRGTDATTSHHLDVGHGSSVGHGSGRGGGH